MTDGPHQALLQFVRNRAGDAFRAAVRYGPDDAETLYVREDVATEELGSAMPAIVDRARGDQPIVVPEVYDRLGDHQATVELHGRAAVVHLPTGPEAGVLISLDRDVAQGLGTFVTQCNEVLADATTPGD